MILCIILHMEIALKIKILNNSYSSILGMKMILVFFFYNEGRNFDNVKRPLI